MMGLLRSANLPMQPARRSVPSFSSTSDPDPWRAHVRRETAGAPNAVKDLRNPRFLAKKKSMNVHKVGPY